MPSSVARYHDPNAEAKLLLGFVAVALVAGTGYICYSRLHVRKAEVDSLIDAGVDHVRGGI